MAFMSLEIIFFRKKNRYYKILHFFSFLSNCCLFSLLNGHIIHYRCSTKVQSNIFWGPKHFLASFNWFLVCCLFVVLFVTAKKIEYQELLIPFYRTIGNCKPIGNFSWFLMVFNTLKSIVFFKKKFSELSNFKVSVFFV